VSPGRGSLEVADLDDKEEEEEEEESNDMSGCWHQRAAVGGVGRTQQSTLGGKWEGGA